MRVSRLTKKGGKMDITDITNLISSVGFPIVMCIVLFKYMEKNDDKREEEAKELREVINNNTLVLTELVSKIDSAVSQLTRKDN